MTKIEVRDSPLEAVMDGRIGTDRLDASLRRIISLKLRLQEAEGQGLITEITETGTEGSYTAVLQD